MAAYTTIDNPELYFQVKIYTGDASTQAVTLDGDENMQPDFVWIKNRATTGYHTIFDSVRGVEKPLWTNADSAEGSDSNTLTAFGSDGFTVGSDAAVNGSGNSLVAWCWKAGTSFTNDASATSVGTIDSAGSSNSTSGFSILTYTGTGSSGSIAHNLGSAPTTLFVKRRNSSDSWTVGHGGNGWNTRGRLDTTQAFGTDTNTWTNTAPTSTVFTLNHNDVNNDGTTFVAYLFAPKQGFSKFGIYEGNGNADGPFIFTGFRPAFVLQKSTAVQGWQLQDNKREGFNGDNDLLQPHDSASESGVNRVDLLSNGFKVITTDAGQNTDGQNYVYWAFAEQPFVNSKGVPCNAR
jgi:hypothetical protein